MGVCGGGGVGVGGVGIKTLYGGNTDFMNHHTKYNKTLKTGWCDILTHPVKYKRISCQLKHTCSVLSSRHQKYTWYSCTYIKAQCYELIKCT